MRPLAITIANSALEKKTFVTNFFLVFCGSLFISLLAQVSAPLPFTPVPISGQTLGVLLVGASLGSRRGALSLLLYLCEGAAGLPVFANGKAGLIWLTAGPTAGYFCGFVLSAFVVGYLCERGWDRNWKTSFLAFLSGTIVIYIPGLLWLGHLIGYDKALTAGLYPFVLGAVIKIFVAMATLKSAWKLVKKTEEL